MHFLIFPPQYDVFFYTLTFLVLIFRIYYYVRNMFPHSTGKALFHPETNPPLQADSGQVSEFERSAQSFSFPPSLHDLIRDFSTAKKKRRPLSPPSSRRSAWPHDEARGIPLAAPLAPPPPRTAGHRWRALRLRLRDRRLPPRVHRRLSPLGQAEGPSGRTEAKASVVMGRASGLASVASNESPFLVVGSPTTPPRRWISMNSVLT